MSDESAPSILRVAVLIACYNRYAVTRCALNTLLSAAAGIAATRFTVFLLDDASPDRTGERICAEWPEVRLVMGDGALFWNRGMHRLVEEARAAGTFDAFLLFNDDVRLLDGRLGDFVATFSKLAEATYPPILVGAMADPETGAVTYSGMRRMSLMHPLRLAHIEPSSTAVCCDAANGNLMLAPRIVMDTVGNLDPRYRHGIGDIDLCYRAIRAGYRVYLAPGYYGYCAKNDLFQRKLLSPLSERLNYFFGPKYDVLGNVRFLRSHGGPLWLLSAMSVVIRATIATFSPGILSWISNVSRGRGTNLAAFR